MKRTFVFIVSSIFVLTLSMVPAYGQQSDENPNIRECKAAVSQAVNNFIKGELLLADPKFKIFFSNDFRYDWMTEEKEFHCMANILIVVYDSPFGKSAYNIAHFHWRKDGKSKPAASVYFYRWQAIDGEADPRIQKDWCNFLKDVYPNELQEQGCQ